MKFALALALLVSSTSANGLKAAAAKGECSDDKKDGCVVEGDDTTKDQVCLKRTSEGSPDDAAEAPAAEIKADASLAKGQSKHMCVSKADADALGAADPANKETSAGGIVVKYEKVEAGDDSEDGAKTLAASLIAASSLAALTLF